MFDTEHVELLPARTTMQITWPTMPTIQVAVGGPAIAVPVSAGNLQLFSPGATLNSQAWAQAIGGGAFNGIFNVWH